MCNSIFDQPGGRGASRPCVTTQERGNEKVRLVFALYPSVKRAREEDMVACSTKSGQSREFGATRRRSPSSLTSTRFAHTAMLPLARGWLVGTGNTNPSATNRLQLRLGRVHTPRPNDHCGSLMGCPVTGLRHSADQGQVVLDFADCPELGIAFEQFGYKVLPAVELARPLTHEMWQGLAPHERKDVRYFRPERVGDVIYNYWD